jgi:glycosidase
MATNYPTASWAKSIVLYEVNVRQYTPQGTFNAFAKHLPRLKKMGVKVIWLMPITPISVEKKQGSLGSYYACSSYTTVNPEFGDIIDFKQLVKEAHQLGLKVIIDWVANHTGCDHHWTKTNKDFYRLDELGMFTERNGWIDVIDLNYDNSSLQTAMIAAMQFWIEECNIDGFRCDMAHLVPLEFWHKARKQCDSTKELYWLAECDEPTYLSVFDTNYAWQWMHETEKLVKGESSVTNIYNVLHQYSNNTQLANKLFFTSNHDENSWNGTEIEKYGKIAKALAVFSFTWQGTPLIYSGQEVGNKKRLAFFDKDCIEWESTANNEIFYTSLSKIFYEINIFQTHILNAAHQTMCYLRFDNHKIWLVVLNLSQQDCLHVTLSHELLKGVFYNAFTGMNFQFNKEISFELMAGDYLVYSNYIL